MPCLRASKEEAHPLTTDYEQILRALLRGRVCMCGVAVDSDEPYRLLAADLERLLACGACGDSASGGR